MTNLDRRTLLSGLAAACLGGAALSGTVSSAGAQTVPAVPNPPVPRLARGHDLVSLTHVQTNAPRVALTFDDGPHPTLTPMLLDILAHYRAKATFYVIGQNARRYPEILHRIVAEGHEIGNHSWSHPVLSRLGNASVLREIDRTQEIVWNTVGALPVTMRPPYGAFSHRQMQMLHDERALTTVVWSVDPEDWRRPGVNVVAQRMVRGARPGAVILAHDIHSPTIRAVPAALEGIQARGLSTVTMSDLLGWGRWGPRGLRYVRAPGADYQG
ncbi:MAG: polysaccharide deacetylase family protein [Rhodobacter sp.]|nr:polysaccharide deacetylase family protein [Paracoccaceae bacterium]MCB1408742.1 polysaccharide deacetylase family protein [Paracoccaceae bacterium]MCC0079739.1 polysaccharide deacetylase family protein [Rhodobacter sp.]